MYFDKFTENKEGGQYSKKTTFLISFFAGGFGKYISYFKDVFAFDKYLE